MVATTRSGVPPATSMPIVVASSPRISRTSDRTPTWSERYRVNPARVCMAAVTDGDVMTASLSVTGERRSSTDGAQFDAHERIGHCRDGDLKLGCVSVTSTDAPRKQPLP